MSFLTFGICHLSASGGFHRRQPAEYGGFDCGDLVRFINFLTVLIPDIKDIDDLIRLGGNFSDPDVEAAVKERISDAKQQARKIVGKDLDNGKKAGTFVVNPDAMGPAGHPLTELTVNRHLFLQCRCQIDPIGKGLFELLFGPHPFIIFHDQTRLQGDQVDVDGRAQPGKHHLEKQIGDTG